MKDEDMLHRVFRDYAYVQSTSNLAALLGDFTAIE